MNAAWIVVRNGFSVILIYIYICRKVWWWLPIWRFIYFSFEYSSYIVRLCCISFERLGVILWVVRRHVLKDRENFFFNFFVIQTSQKWRNICAHSTINRQIKKLKIYVKEHVIASSVLQNSSERRRCSSQNIKYQLGKIKKILYIIYSTGNKKLLNVEYLLHKTLKRKKSLSRNRMKI